MPQFSENQSHIYLFKFDRTGFSEMKEDPKFTLQILEYIAGDDIGFPANLSLHDLHGVFPKEDWDRLSYHVLCAYQCDLLLGEYSKTETLDEGTQYHIGDIAGLTPKGCQYVAESNSKFLEKAKKKIVDAGLEVTTGRLVEAMNTLISSAL